MLAWNRRLVFSQWRRQHDAFVPWGHIHLTVLMLSLAWAGISLFRAPPNTPIFVFFSSAIMGFPLVPMWIVASFGD